MKNRGQVNMITFARGVADRIERAESELGQRIARLEGALGVGAVPLAPATSNKHMALQFTIQKFAGAGKRVFSGIASTGSIDKAGDTLNPRGAVFTLPLPLLLQHDHSKPVGWVRSANVTSAGIEVDCEIAEGIGEADEAWKMVKSGLVSGLSVGFVPLESRPTKTGIHFERWGWHELSIVTVACNSDARVTAKAGKGAIKLHTLPVGAVKLKGATREDQNSY